MKAKLIDIEIRHGSEGLFFATSPSLKGLHLADRDRLALLRELPKVIAALYEAKGTRVVVHEVESADNELRYVAVPRAVV